MHDLQNVWNTLHAIHTNFKEFGVTPSLRSFLKCDPFLEETFEGKTDEECVAAVEGLFGKLIEAVKNRVNQWRADRAKRVEALRKKKEFLKSLNADGRTIAELFSLELVVAYYKLVKSDKPETETITVKLADFDEVKRYLVELEEYFAIITRHVGSMDVDDIENLVAKISKDLTVKARKYSYVKLDTVHKWKLAKGSEIPVFKTRATDLLKSKWFNSKELVSLAPIVGSIHTNIKRIAEVIDDMEYTSLINTNSEDREEREQAQDIYERLIWLPYNTVDLTKRVGDAVISRPLKSALNNKLEL